MFFAMNRFRIAPGREAEFEAVWRERDSRLKEVPGFLEFRLLKGPEKGDHVLYVSHSAWESREAFEAWTRSEAFRHAHASAGATKDLYLSAPELETFESVVQG
ncbi:MAG: antibiotic biosynthesis monooxygenase family protein [Pseudomonadota bacterium]